MAKINWRRVVLGGFLWVVVFNVLWLSAWFLFLRTEWRSALAAPGRTFPPTLESLVIWLLLTLVGGIIAIWLYAAIRPSYGAGPKTAAYAGFVIWMMSGLGPTLWLAHIVSLPPELVARTVVSGLVADVVATIAGAWPYTEG
jgi:hypothetical protein